MITDSATQDQSKTTAIGMNTTDSPVVLGNEDQPSTNAESSGPALEKQIEGKMEAIVNANEEFLEKPQVPDQSPSESDLPTPPSNLLGNILNMNTGVPIPTQPPPSSMYFEEVANGDVEETENVTRSVQPNETVMVFPHANQPEQTTSIPVMSDAVQQLPEHYDLKAELNEASPQVKEKLASEELELPNLSLVPGEGIPPGDILLEERIPPIVRDQMHRFDLNPPKVINIPNEIEIENMATENKFVENSPLEEIPKYPPPPPVEYHGNELPGYQTPEDPKEVFPKAVPFPEEAPKAIYDQEIQNPIDSVVETTSEGPPFIPTDVPLVETTDKPLVAEIRDADPKLEEEVVSGSTFFASLIDKTLSMFSAIDFSGLLGSDDSQKDSVIIGEHVEGAEDLLESGRYSISRQFD